MCETSEKFRNLLRRSREDGFMTLSIEDRLFLMDQREHCETCADCADVMEEHMDREAGC